MHALERPGLTYPESGSNGSPEGEVCVGGTEARIGDKSEIDSGMDSVLTITGGPLGAGKDITGGGGEAFLRSGLRAIGLDFGRSVAGGLTGGGGVDSVSLISPSSLA